MSKIITPSIFPSVFDGKTPTEIQDIISVIGGASGLTPNDTFTGIDGADPNLGLWTLNAAASSNPDFMRLSNNTLRTTKDGTGLDTPTVISKFEWTFCTSSCSSNVY